MSTEFQAAFALHQRGELLSAQTLYEKVLKKQPRHFDALHLLGAIAAQRGRPKRALELFERAISVNGGYAEAHFNRGVVLQQLGRLEPALASYDRAVALKPDHPDAWFNRANLLKDRGQFEAALASYERAIASRPRFAQAFSNRGNVQRLLGQTEAALRSYDQAIAMDAGYAPAYYNRAGLLAELGEWEAALASYDRTVALVPIHGEAHFERGVVLGRLARFEAALASFDQAVAIMPTHAQAWFARANRLKDLDQLEAALASYDQAIKHQPHFVEALSNRGNVLRELRQTEAALASFDEAIAADPDHAGAYVNRGALLADLNRMEDALADYDRAIALRPDDAHVNSNRGNLLLQIQLVDQALASHDRAIAIQPDSPIAQFNRSIGLLLRGDFANGWRAYEWRWKNPYSSCSRERREFAQPLWLGAELIRAKTILLHGEQGFGDTLQFCRYAKPVADLGARVILEVRGPLAALLESLEGVSQLVTRGDPLPEFDYQCPLMSLPLAFNTNLETIPQPGEYLRTDPAKVARWAKILGPRSLPRIGLTWSGSAAHINDRNRSLRLADWVPHLPPGFQYVSLQKEVRAADQSTLDGNPQIVNPAAALTDFSETAALCECMDLVISVCTSTAHLSGALGRKTWVLLSYAADWRWLLDREDSPWYRSVRLYRQPRMSDWDAVFARVREDLIRGFQEGRVCERNRR